MFYLSPEGDRYYLGRAFSYGDYQYSAGAATHAKFIELGFTQVLVEPTPDPRFYIYSGPNNEGKYNATPRNLEKTQLSFVQKQIHQTQTLLLSTDWLLVRSSENQRGVEVPVPSAVLTNRNDVRAVCDNNCDLICGTLDIPELEALIKAPATILSDKQDPNSERIPNPDPHLEPYPQLEPSEYLTLALVAPKPPATE